MAIQFHDSPFHAVETPEMASKLVLKADLMIMIRDIIIQLGWTQLEAADHLGVSQPRISDLINGKIDKFTLDALFTILDDLGFRTTMNLDTLENTTISISRVA